MPKQFKTYTRFEGGLNTKTNARSIQENELDKANNAIVDEFGAIKSCGKAVDNDTNYTDPSVTAMQPGYGLFQASFDFNRSASNTNTVRTFLANADDGTNAVVHVLDGTTWDTSDISLGAVTGSEQAKVIYHIADGSVTSCDTNIINVSTALKDYKYKKAMARWKGSDGASLLSTQNVGWADYDTKLSKPTSGICGDQVVGVSAGAGNNTTTLIAVDSDAFANFETELDLGTYYAIRTTASAEVISDRTNDTTLNMPGGGTTWANSEAYSIYPPQGTGFNLDFTVASGGSWAAGTYEFGTTFLYDGNQESLIRKLSGSIAVSADNKVTCIVLANENPSSEGYSLDITGGRIYYRLSGSDDTWVLFGDISFVDGARSSLEADFTHWTKAVSSTGYLHSTFISYSQNIDSYESLNGFSPSSQFISIGENGEKYQTSVVTNRRVFIANVQYTTDGGNLQNFGDQIRYTQINKFNTFPELNFIDIGVNDGESFVKLEAFADRLLAFKERKLYIINIGGGSDTQWFLESEHKNMGVEFHAATVKTDFGIAWVNKNGLFFYDGSQIRNLQTKILESQWSLFVDHLTMIAYEPTHKHLVVIRDADDESSNNGDAYIYSFITNSFTFVEDLVADSNKTNPITDAYNKLTMGTGTAEIVSYDGEPDAGTTFDLILKDDDFGMPNTVKKIYGVTVEYSSSAASSNGVKYIYTNSSGVKQDAYVNLGSLSDTGNSGEYDPPLMYVDKFNLSTPISVSSFQVKLDLGGSSVHKVNNVAVEYRPIYKRVT